MKKEKGIVLVTVLILVLFFTVAGVAIMMLSRKDVGESQRNRKSQMALAAAEAGIERAICRLRENISWTGDTITAVVVGTAPDTASFISSVRSVGTNMYEITCTGTATRVMNVGGGKSFEAKKKLRAVVELTPATPGTLNSVMYTPCYIGGSNAPLTLTGNVNVGQCGQTSNNMIITGEITSSTAWLNIDANSLRALANSQGRWYKGDVTGGAGQRKDQFVGTNVSDTPNNTIPSTFWFSLGDSIPNVTFIDKTNLGTLNSPCSLDMTGNCGCIIGGIIIVLGDLPACNCNYTQPANGNVTFGGNVGQLNAAIYCTGQYRNNGAPFTQGGCIVAGGGVFNGSNSGLAYNAAYAQALGSFITSSGSPATIRKRHSLQDISY